jgi:3-phosphoshikimate 1-carboxyvinyltransferase
MRAIIGRSVIKGSISIPPSKSMTIRALVCAALSAGESQIIHPLVCEDTIAAASVLTQLGTVIREGDDSWTVSGGKFRAGSSDLNCRESATTMRLMTAVCSLVPGYHRLIGGPSLSHRPIGSRVDCL